MNISIDQVAELLADYTDYATHSHFEPFSGCELAKWGRFECCNYHRHLTARRLELRTNCLQLDTHYNIESLFKAPLFSRDWWKKLCEVVGLPYPEELYCYDFRMDGQLFVLILQEYGIPEGLLILARGGKDMMYVTRVLSQVLVPDEVPGIRKATMWLGSRYDPEELRLALADERIFLSLQVKLEELL